MLPLASEVLLRTDIERPERSVRIRERQRRSEIADLVIEQLQCHRCPPGEEIFQSPAKVHAGVVVVDIHS